MTEMNEEITEYYSSKRIVEISQGGYYKEKIEFMRAHLSRLKKVGSKIKILDVACNDGYLTRIYSRYGEVMGIDINKEAINKCSRRGLTCLHTDIHGLGEKYNDYFDVVIAGDIIEHVFDTDTFLLEAKKKLKRKGVLLLTTANLASFGRRLMLLLGKNPFVEYSVRLPTEDSNCGHIRYYTLKDLNLQLEVLGFKDVKIYGDVINLAPSIYIPNIIAKHFPSLSRFFLVYCEK